MEYRHLTIDERELASDLFTSYYDADVYCTEARYFDWLHRDSPLRLESAGEGNVAVFGAIDGGVLQGCISYLPTEVYVGGERRSAVVTTESLARPESRGVYGLLARRLVGRFDYCFVMGATAFLRDLYVKHLGAHYVHEMPRVVLVGDVAALARLRAGGPPGEPLLGANAWAEDARRLASGRTWAEIGSAAELDDAYWAGLLRREVATCRRDPAWIDWRYFRHPHLEYTVLSADASQSAGIAVLRHERLPERECSVLRLLEFLPTEGSEGALAGAVASYALEVGCAMLDFFCADDDRLSQLPPAFIRPERHRPLDLPYLLQPPEWRERRSINLLSLRNRRKRRSLPELGCGQVYLTKGDGAQDIALDRGYRSAHLRCDD